ncbi:MAG: MarR family transcriptional regulator [Chloroflexota bacterium]
MEDTLDHQLHHLLLDIDLIYLGINKQVLSKHNMRRVRYYTMRHLYLTPDITLGQLSDLTLVDRASLSRMIFSLEKDGLVIRKTNQTDRRVFKLSLTEDGNDLFLKVQVDMDADIRQRFKRLSQETKTELLELNNRMKVILTQHAADMS